ncbi:MAG: tetratricopeptide repeat protein [Chlorobiales bacterium]
MGNAYLRQRRFADALRHYNESLNCAQNANLNREQGAAYYAIGNVYAEQERFEEAIENFQKALVLMHVHSKSEVVAKAIREGFV